MEEGRGRGQESTSRRAREREREKKGGERRTKQEFRLKFRNVRPRTRRRCPRVEAEKIEGEKERENEKEKGERGRVGTSGTRESRMNERCRCIVRRALAHYVHAHTYTHSHTHTQWRHRHPAAERDSPGDIISRCAAMPRIFTSNLLIVLSRSVPLARAEVSQYILHAAVLHPHSPVLRLESRSNFREFAGRASLSPFVESERRRRSEYPFVLPLRPSPSALTPGPTERRVADSPRS